MQSINQSILITVNHQWHTQRCHRRNLQHDMYPLSEIGGSVSISAFCMAGTKRSDRQMDRQTERVIAIGHPIGAYRGPNNAFFLLLCPYVDSCVFLLKTVTSYLSIPPCWQLYPSCWQVYTNVDSYALMLTDMPGYFQMSPNVYSCALILTVLQPLPYWQSCLIIIIILLMLIVGPYIIVVP